MGTPNFSVPKGAVYLDVEGVPDRDFYYLVGLRWRDADRDIQRSFWADTASQEREMWLSCLLALGGSSTLPITDLIMGVTRRCF